METIFSRSSLLVMPFWALMMLAPRWKVTRRLMQSPIAIIAPCLLYLALVLPRFGEVFPAVLRPTLDGIVALLSTEAGATIAWAHFLAFDLFVGRWAYLDSRERNVSALLMAPVLFLTLMLGPIGFLLYLLVRQIPADSGTKILAALKTAWKDNRALTLVGLLMVGTLAACLVGAIVNPKVITGAPAWIKPAKFAISIAFYAFTLIYLLRFIEGRERLVRVISVVTAICLVIEMAVITIQVVRGTASHFNMTTLPNAIVWNIMGAAIVPVWIMGGIATYLLIRQRNLNPAFGASLRWGGVLAVIGMGLAFLMTGPRPYQMAQLKAGKPASQVGAIGGHTVGAIDGGAGMPVVGWSKQGGDLRIPHFVGLHAVQVLPLLGAFVIRRRRFSVWHQTAFVHASGAAYGGALALVTWQALRGQPLLSPDALTGITAGVLAIGTVLALAGILLHGYRRTLREYWLSLTHSHPQTCV
jgi:hypothetical protein